MSDKIPVRTRGPSVPSGPKAGGSPVGDQLKGRHLIRFEDGEAIDPAELAAVKAAVGFTGADDDLAGLKAAVATWQSSKHIAADGIVGDQTWAAIDLKRFDVPPGHRYVAPSAPAAPRKPASSFDEGDPSAAGRDPKLNPGAVAPPPPPPPPPDPAAAKPPDPDPAAAKPPAPDPAAAKPPAPDPAAAKPPAPPPPPAAPKPNVPLTPAQKQSEAAAKKLDAPKLDVSKMGAIDKTKYVIQRMVSQLPADLREKCQALLSPTALAFIATTLAVWGAGHAFGFGEAIDLIVAGVGYLALGSEAIHALTEFAKGIGSAISANNQDELDQAGDHLAKGLSTVMVDTVLALATHGAAKAVGRARKIQLPGRQPPAPAVVPPEAPPPPPPTNVEPPPQGAPPAAPTPQGAPPAAPTPQGAPPAAPTPQGAPPAAPTPQGAPPAAPTPQGAPPAAPTPQGAPPAAPTPQGAPPAAPTPQGAPPAAPTPQGAPPAAPTPQGAPPAAPTPQGAPPAAPTPQGAPPAAPTPQGAPPAARLPTVAERNQGILARTRERLGLGNSAPKATVLAIEKTPEAVIAKCAEKGYGVPERVIIDQGGKSGKVKAWEVMTDKGPKYLDENGKGLFATKKIERIEFAEAGTDPQAVARAMIQRAKVTGQPQAYTFEGTRLVANPGDSAGKVLAPWAQAKGVTLPPEGLSAQVRAQYNRAIARLRTLPHSARVRVTTGLKAIKDPAVRQAIKAKARTAIPSWRKAGIIGTATTLQPATPFPMLQRGDPKGFEQSANNVLWARAASLFSAKMDANAAPLSPDEFQALSASNPNVITVTANHRDGTAEPLKMSIAESNGQFYVGAAGDDDVPGELYPVSAADAEALAALFKPVADAESGPASPVPGATGQ